MRLIFIILSLAFIQSCATVEKIDIGTGISTELENIDFKGNPYDIYTRKVNNRKIETQVVKIDYPSKIHIADRQLSMPFINYLDISASIAKEPVVIDYAVVFAAFTYDYHTRFQASGQGLLVDAIAQSIVKATSKEEEFTYDQNSIVCRVQGSYKGNQFSIEEFEPYEAKVVMFSQNENQSLRLGATNAITKCGKKLRETLEKLNN